MRTEDLQAKGLTQEQIDYVMAENGKDLNSVKQERDNYRTQLQTAQTTLKSFEGVNVQELQGKVATLTADLAAVNWRVKYKKRKRRTLRNPYCPLRARKWLEMGLFQR